MGKHKLGHTETATRAPGVSKAKASHEEVTVSLREDAAAPNFGEKTPLPTVKGGPGAGGRRLPPVVLAPGLGAQSRALHTPQTPQRPRAGMAMPGPALHPAPVGSRQAMPVSILPNTGLTPPHQCRGTPSSTRPLQAWSSPMNKETTSPRPSGTLLAGPLPDAHWRCTAGAPSSLVHQVLARSLLCRQSPREMPRSGVSTSPPGRPRGGCSDSPAPGWTQ